MKKTKIKWYQLYYLLAIFDILIICGSIYLNHRIMDVYVKSVDDNQESASLLISVTQLSQLAGYVNAPGNDVFDTHNVNSEIIKRDHKLEVFNIEMKNFRHNIEYVFNTEESTLYLVQIDEVGLAMKAMVDKQNQIFSLLLLDESQQAGQRMAEMDRKYYDIRVELAELSDAIALFQARQFREQIKYAQFLSKFEYLIGTFLLFIVLMVAGFGRHIAKAMQQNEAEEKAYLELLEEQQKILRANEEYSHAVFEAVTDGIVILNHHGCIQHINQSIEILFNYQTEELIGQDINQIIYNEKLANIISSKFVELTKPLKNIEAIGIQKAGYKFPIEFSINCMNMSEKRMYIIYIHDITERKKNELKILKLAFSDGLTGLANRSSFDQALVTTTQSAVFSNKKIALLLLDLDKFKEINDTHGHPCGDELLCVIANRIVASIRNDDIAARLGGDEFAIILTDFDTIEYVNIIAERIRQKINEPLYIDENKIEIKASIGISIFPSDDSNISELIKKADFALYQAKDSGSGIYEFFDPITHANKIEKNNLEQELIKAIDKDELELYFQPKINIKTKKFLGVEALIRWNHPTKGLIQPGLFLDIAESSEVILLIDMWVVKTACYHLKSWHKAGIRPLHIAINISARQFQDTEFVDRIHSIIRTTNIDPDWLELEITESAMMDDSESAVATISSLKQLGVSTTIDDFGTGYSSLAYLRQFQVNSLKIDRSFVNELTTKQHDVVILEAIINLGHKLGLQVIAEGIETKEQLEFLHKIGCDEAQGYLIGRPMKINVFKDWYNALTKER